MLIQARGRLESACVGRMYGAATTVANGCVASGNLRGGSRNLIAGEGISDKKAAIPVGALAPVAWFLPQVAGGMSSRTDFTFTAGANLAEGRNIAGAAPVTFTVDGSAAAIAALAGTAGIAFTGSATASAVFNMEGMAAFAFAASADGTAIASIAGASTVSFSVAADPLTTIWLQSAPIETALTADVIAAAVMASAVESGLTLTDAMRLISAALAGKVTVDGPTVTFRDVNDTKDRITATTTPEGDRTAVTLDAG